MDDQPTPNKGQDALIEINKYFEGPEIDPKKFREFKGLPVKKNIKAMDRYFKKSSTEDYFAFFLVLPGLFLIAYIILTRLNAKPYEPKVTIPQKDWETFEMVRLQKSLEEFDRDFLVQLAQEFNCKPIYKILMEIDVFERVEKRLKASLIEKNINPDTNQRYQSLLALKKKIF